MVEAGLQSKRRAMTNLGVSDPKEEFAQSQEEQAAQPEATENMAAVGSEV